MFLELSHLLVHYAGRSAPAVNDVSLGLRAGEIGVLIGPSGCGKTTLLRAVAGLERAQAGSISLAQEIVSSDRQHVPAEQRLEATRRNPRQIGGVGIGPDRFDGEATRSRMRHRVRIDLEASRSRWEHRQQVASAATEVERRAAAEASMAAQIELPHDAAQSAALDLALEIDGVEGNRHGW
jgi:ABC-type glutathione transport system ATPase component